MRLFRRKRVSRKRAVEVAVKMPKDRTLQDLIDLKKFGEK